MPAESQDNSPSLSDSIRKKIEESRGSAQGAGSASSQSESARKRAEGGHGATDQAKVFAAKVDAAFKTARLISLIFGTLALVGAAFISVLLSGIFHLNFLITLAGSFVGVAILLAGIVPLKVIWKSKLVTAYQEAGLFVQANELAFEDIADKVDAILEGKLPLDVDDKLRLRLSQAKLIYIRQGQMRKARKISQYVLRSKPDEPYNISTLASINCELGYFEEAMDAARGNLDSLLSDGRDASPVASTSLLCMINACIYLHRKDEAKKWLERLSKKIEVTDGQREESRTDKVVRAELNVTEIDTAFYWHFLGKYQIVCRDSAARTAVMKAEKIMARDENQRRLQLFYPEILVDLARISMAERDYRTALARLEDAMKRYHTKTQFRGPGYHLASLLTAFTKMKVKGANTIAQIEEALMAMEAELQPMHPNLAAGYACLGDAQLHFGEQQKARAAYEKALLICRTLYPQGDDDTREMEEKLAAIAA